MQPQPAPDTIQQAVQNPQEIIRELCDRSFWFFFQQFWHCISSDEFQPNWHIEYLCEELQQVAERVARREPNEYDLLINIPPGTTKTTVCSIMFPVWCWTKWPWMRFITGSYSGILSLESADYSRDLIRHQDFQRVYPDIRIKKDKEGKTNYRIVRHLPDGQVEIGGGRLSTSVGGSVTGFHAHIVIIDDPLDPQRAASDVELKTANDFFDQTLPTRKVNKKVTHTCLIMQRLHQDDPSGHLLDKKGRLVPIRHICLPGEINTGAYAEKVSPQELRARYVDGLLDPVRLDADVLHDLLVALGQYGFAGQVGQTPTPPSDGMFQVDRMLVIQQLPPQISILQTVRYWDKAGTEEVKKRKGKGPAYTVGVKMSRLANGKYLVQDVVRGRWASEKREEIIRATAEADGPDVQIWHEQEPGSGGKDSARATTTNLAGFSARAERPVGDKIYRADPWSVQVNLGNVLLLIGPWNHEYKEEHRFFPFSTFKDQVDGSSGAFAKLARKREVWVGRRKR